MHQATLVKLRQRVDNLMTEQHFQRTLQRSPLFAKANATKLGISSYASEFGRSGLLPPSSGLPSSGASTPRNGLLSREGTREHGSETDEVEDLNALLQEMMQPITQDEEMDTPNASKMNNN